ncbi:MAG: division/cell wall cluster transcriptional repressor MraZ [Hyphomicrobiales bacterium]|nr:MAG: division/cell wall cluster transcriptional repressor MraZ [Hyphomicrobiales bacterium]
MEPFVSSFQNKIDKKGRVSVPAAFRTILDRDVQADGVHQVFCYPAIEAPAVECGGVPLLSKIYQLLEDLPPYSEERDVLSTALFGGSLQLKIDSDGRIIIPDEMREHANLTDYVTFVGMGDKFRIWSPELFASYMAEAREKAIEHRKLFGMKYDRK